MSVQPSVFLSHGAGPAAFTTFDSARFAELDKNSAVAGWYRQLRTQLQLPSMPVAIVVVSAHWAAEPVQIAAGERPELLYDYYGFPPETYEIEYKAPGDPALAGRIQGLLKGVGVKGELNAERKWDHGVFIPLKLLFPEATIPVVEVSLPSDLAPETVASIGRALGPLRAENMLIMGSGQASHDLSSIGASPSWLQPFCSRVREIVATEDAGKRVDELVAFTNDPLTRKAHPTTEHWVPILAAAAAASGPSTQLYDAVVAGSLWMGSWKFD